MQENTLQTRISSLASFLRSSVEQLLRDKQILQLTCESVNSNELSQNMVNVFQQTLINDREKYINELIAKLSKIQEEKEKIEAEFTLIQSQGTKDTDQMMNENNQLKIQIESLESKLKSVEWKQSKKEKTYKNCLKEKEAQSIQVKAFVESTQDAQQSLQQKIKEIKGQFIKLQRNQIRLIGQAKTMCTTQIAECVEANSSAHKSIQSKQVSQVTEQISKEKINKQSLESQCQKLLDILNSYAGNLSHNVNISVDDFSTRTGEIRDFIDDIIEAKKKAAVDDLKREVAQSLPGIEIGNQNVTDAVDRHLKAKIKAKEIECERLLRESEQRETTLKQKLKEALERIQHLQSSESDYRYIDEFERQKKEWETTRMKLDQTMVVVNKTRTSRSSTSRSTTSDE